MADETGGVTAETLGELLEDEYARSILAETSTEALSAEELQTRCDASAPTIYRRLGRLQEFDMIDEKQVLDPDGHHYRQFSARLERVTIELREGEYHVSIERSQQDAVERFTELYERLR